jgi:hypothetical protein
MSSFNINGLNFKMLVVLKQIYIKVIGALKIY